MPQPRRVLHVDDEPQFLELVSALLTRDDETLQITQATDPKTGLELLSSADPPFECVLSDYDMPGMNGLEFLLEVRQRDADLPFLLYTGQKREVVAAEGVANGLTGYIKKGTGHDHYLLLNNQITESIKGARAKRDREVLERALDATGQAVCIVGSDGRYKHANSKYLALYGYEGDEILGQQWGQLHPNVDVELLVAELLPEMADDQLWEGKWVGQRADNSEFMGETTVEQLPAGDIIIVVTEVTDDTTSTASGSDPSESPAE